MLHLGTGIPSLNPLCFATDMTTSSPLRVAYRWLTAARPIPLDKRAINEATSEVTRRIMLAINSRSGDPDEPLSSQRIPRQIDGGSFPLSQVIRDGEGLVPSDLHVPIQVRFLNRPPRNMTLLLGGSLVSQSDLFSGFQHSLEIRASSALSASEYRDQNGLLQREIYSVLLHEVTHAVDLVGRMRDDYSPADARDGAAAYINQPHEIRAFMRQVVEEVIPVPPRTGRSYLPPRKEVQHEC